MEARISVPDLSLEPGYNHTVSVYNSTPWPTAMHLIEYLIGNGVIIVCGYYKYITSVDSRLPDTCSHITFTPSPSVVSNYYRGRIN